MENEMKCTYCGKDIEVSDHYWVEGSVFIHTPKGGPADLIDLSIRICRECWDTTYPRIRINYDYMVGE